MCPCRDSGKPAEARICDQRNGKRDHAQSGGRRTAVRDLIQKHDSHADTDDEPEQSSIRERFAASGVAAAEAASQQPSEHDAYATQDERQLDQHRHNPSMTTPPHANRPRRLLGARTTDRGRRRTLDRIAPLSAALAAIDEHGQPDHRIRLRAPREVREFLEGRPRVATEVTGQVGVMTLVDVIQLAVAENGNHR